MNMASGRGVRRRIPAPAVCNPEARERFRSAARGFALDPDNPWLGGYVGYEWAHGRHVLECCGVEIAGSRALEFGCNIGATSIVLATLGASVTAVDVSAKFVELARLNAACFALEESIEFLHVPDTTRLPFPDGQFDLITCNSVLEYVPYDALETIQRELDRVLKPGGTIVVEATSNRLSPRETHSGQWLVNYLPRCTDRLVARHFTRGVFPWHVRRGFGRGYHDVAALDRGGAYLESRRRMGMSAVKLLLLRAGAWILAPLRFSVGLVTPSMAVWLRKNASHEPPRNLLDEPLRSEQRR